ncbi:hypothetical protein [Paenibacillus sp. SI8]|uniref:hypothetical protein n=1 Tax=unclassified Paenibacillus TaxID=185978 RepID=UPI0034653566
MSFQSWRRGAGNTPFGALLAGPNVGRVVSGISGKLLAALTGNDEQNPRLDLPCREVFARGNKAIEVIGPFPEVEAEAVAAHAGFWS